MNKQNTICNINTSMYFAKNVLIQLVYLYMDWYINKVEIIASKL